MSKIVDTSFSVAAGTVAALALIAVHGNQQPLTVKDAVALEQQVGGRWYPAYITRVVDGDTFYATVDLGWNVQINDELRLDGVDTPEKFGVTKEAGLLAKKYVIEKIESKNVLVSPVKKEKYGRWLTKVNTEGVDLSTDLIDKNLAKPYFGGKKE